MLDIFSFLDFLRRFLFMCLRIICIIVFIFSVSFGKFVDDSMYFFVVCGLFRNFGVRDFKG